MYVANIETDRGTKEKIRFYDTQGVDVDYQDYAIPKHLLAAADGFLLVYSVEVIHLTCSCFSIANYRLVKIQGAFHIKNGPFLGFN